MMEGKIIKLSSLKDDELLVVGDECQLMTKANFIKNIADFREMEIYTAESRHASFNAKEILENAIEQEECDSMYEDWGVNVWDDITDEDIAVIQNVLDNILQKDPSKHIAYYQDKPVEVDIC